MPGVFLVHWASPTADEHVTQLRAAGYDVAHEPLGQAVLQQLRNDPPAAILIDLSRASTRGRDIALALRTYKSFRSVPLGVVEGDPEFVARVR